MKKIFILLLFCGYLQAQDFVTSENEILTEVENLKQNDEKMISLLYDYHSSLNKQYSSQRAKAYEAVRDAKAFNLMRSTEQKLKDIDNAENHYNKINELYQKSLKTCDLYFDYLKANYNFNTKKH